jgi:hypothetical protein
MRDCKNPGTQDPADQAFPAPDTLRRATAPASSAATCSTGEVDLPALRPHLSTPLPGRGLAAEIMADSSSQVRSVAPHVAETRPPARDVRADAGRPGGLPTNVIIR